jgi:DNA-binding transcriptional LysR family regulator
MPTSLRSASRAKALKGLGLAHLTEGHVQPYVSRCELVRVLFDWCPPFLGYRLYYPSRRQPSPAFSLLVEALRFRGE